MIFGYWQQHSRHFFIFCDGHERGGEERGRREESHYANFVTLPLSSAHVSREEETANEPLLSPLTYSAMAQGKKRKTRGPLD